MINETLYHKTVDILVQAYFNDTLKHGDCAGCAVGNLIAAHRGYRLKLLENEQNYYCWIDNSGDIVKPEWDDVFSTSSQDKRQFINLCNLAQEAKKQLSCTGYHWSELAEIEKAFELAPKGNSDEEYMFNGLMAVVDVLDEIHENKSDETTQTAKSKFQKLLYE